MMNKFLIAIILFLGYQFHVFGQKGDSSVSYYLPIAEEKYIQNNFLDALQIYENIYVKDSTLEIVVYRLGVCYAKLFSYNKSTQYFVKSMKMKYRVGDALFNVGLNYSSQQKDVFALAYFKLAYKYLPDDDEIKNKIHEFEELTSTK